MTGTARVRSSSRNLRASARPEVPGSIQSSRIRSGSSARIKVWACSAPKARKTLWPANDRLTAISSWRACSSSPTRMVLDIGNMSHTMSAERREHCDSMGGIFQGRDEFTFCRMLSLRPQGLIGYHCVINRALTMQQNPDSSPDSANTHFGFQSVPEGEKARKVAEVFHSVASRYDVMNDLMSGGLHRAWKAFTIGRAAIRPGMKVLDIAGGTGDLARAFARRAGPSGEVWLTDINDSMLRVGRDRLTDAGLLLPIAVCDAERLPFPSGYFDRVSVAFGLRNMTHKDRALAEMTRVLKPGGKLLVLEFSRVAK